MKKLFILTITLISTLTAFSCEDFSGKYKIENPEEIEYFPMDLKSQYLGNKRYLKISQKDCTEVTFEYYSDSEFSETEEKYKLLIDSKTILYRQYNSENQNSYIPEFGDHSILFYMIDNKYLIEDDHLYYDNFMRRDFYEVSGTDKKLVGYIYYERIQDEER